MALHRIQTALGVGFTIALFFEQCGCTSVHVATSPDDQRSGPDVAPGRLIGSYSELKPDAQPGLRADMVMAGTRIPVDVSVKSTGSLFEILLRAHGQTFEREVYRDDPKSFSLVEAAGDRYSPDLELVRFPMRVGDGWNWHGTVSSGGIRRTATASVDSSTTHLYDNGATTEAVKVEVNLSLYSEGTKMPAKRKLTFEFVPGKGVDRREFGDASVREPAGP
jgi:hypothetical protein